MSSPKTAEKIVYYHKDAGEIGAIFDDDLFRSINRVDHIQETERLLEEMKTTITDKKVLQKERNVRTAQLSRDRKKVENEMLRQRCIDLTQTLNKVRN